MDYSPNLYSLTWNEEYGDWDWENISEGDIITEDINIGLELSFVDSHGDTH